MSSPSLPSRIESLRCSIDRYLLECVPETPESMYSPVRETLGAGGKRVRPILTALCASDTTTEGCWLPAAGAVELLHTFTLVHDDIMDNASSRRGKPTMHVAHGVNTAILSGDVIIALAIESLCRSQSPQLSHMLEEFGLAFRLVCEGQALDKEFETRDDITVEEYLHMIDLKTSKVLELAAVLGAYAGDNGNLEALRSFAHHIGLAFQISDDLLDLTANEAEFGKTIGGDILEGKRTLLFVLASQQCESLNGEDRSLLDRIRSRAATTADIPSARSLFDRIGVLGTASRMAQAETAKAKEALRQLPASHQRDALEAYGDLLLKRMS